MKKSLFVFALVSVFSVANSFAEAPLNPQEILHEGDFLKEVQAHPNEEVTANAEPITGISLYRSQIEFTSKSGEVETLSVAQLPIKVGIWSAEAMPHEAAMAIYDELQSSTHHYRVHARSESESEKWSVDELVNGKVVSRMSMIDFMRLALKNQSSKYPSLKSIKNYLIKLDLGICDNSKQPSPPNGDPKSADQIATDGPAPAIGAPAITDTQALAGTAL